jgi:hypothetical protein
VSNAPPRAGAGAPARGTSYWGHPLESNAAAATTAAATTASAASALPATSYQLQLPAGRSPAPPSPVPRVACRSSSLGARRTSANKKAKCQGVAQRRSKEQKGAGCVALALSLSILALELHFNIRAQRIIFGGPAVALCTSLPPSYMLHALCPDARCQVSGHGACTCVYNTSTAPRTRTRTTAPENTYSIEK